MTKDEERVERRTSEKDRRSTEDADRRNPDRVNPEKEARRQNSGRRVADK